MKILKVMSIIGIVWVGICVLTVIVCISDNSDSGAAGWGFMGLLYALPYSIVGLIQSTKVSKTLDVKSVADELLKLNELKEKGVLTEEEFNSKKTRMLKY